VEVVNLHVKCLLQGVSLELQREFNIIAQLDVKGNPIGLLRFHTLPWTIYSL